MKLLSKVLFCLSLTALVAQPTAWAQWRTETYELNGGWNAIQLLVDTEDATIDSLFVSSYPQIEEIWRWNADDQDPVILDSPDDPFVGFEWRVWRRDDLARSRLFALSPNHSYLIKVELGSPPFTLSIKGKAISPKVKWRSDGLNLVGFPARESNPPSLDAFLQPVNLIDSSSEVFAYVGGELQENVNPARISPSLPIKRGQAYWIRSGKYSDYTGPLDVQIALRTALDFGDTGTTARIVLRNRANTALQARLHPLASEAPPNGDPVPQAVPLLRLQFDSETGKREYVPLVTEFTVNLEPLETIGITVAIDRSALTGDFGSTAASLLKVSDSRGLSEVYLPISAEKRDLSGLWVGQAEITRVQNQLQRFQKDADGVYLVDDNGKHIPEYILDDNGDPVLDTEGNPIPVQDQELNATAQAFPLRLILNVDEQTGQATFLSQIFRGITGLDADGIPQQNVVFQQSDLSPEYLESALRISATHLPPNTQELLDGTFGIGQSISGVLVVGANDSSNPFIHIYHPDHDNLDARFEFTLPDGIESFRIQRNITLTFDADRGEVDDPAWGSTLLTGTYSETFSGIHKNQIAVQGVFAIRWISE